MSDNLIPISDEQAKLGQEVLKTLRALGPFLNRAIGSRAEDLIGYLGFEWLRVRRAENMATMMSEAKARLEARGVQEAQPATLTVALPILQGAADEDRPELVDLWARLLANAMDPALRNLEGSFIDAAKKLDPPDALILRYIFQNNMQQVQPGNTSPNNTSIGQIAQALNLRGIYRRIVSIKLRIFTIFACTAEWQLGFYGDVPGVHGCLLSRGGSKRGARVSAGHHRPGGRTAFDDPAHRRREEPSSSRPTYSLCPFHSPTVVSVRFRTN